MQLSIAGDVHLLGRLVQGFLVSMNVGGVEDVDANGGTPVVGLRLGRKCQMVNMALTLSSTSGTGRFA